MTMIPVREILLRLAVAAAPGAAFATLLVLFGLVVLGWFAQRFNLKCRMRVFRFTTSHAENVMMEIQRLLSELKVKMQHFSVSMVGEKSVVEFDADVSYSQEEAILNRLNRPGVVRDRKSTRLNSSHSQISYAVFCLKKKKK